MIRTLLLVFTLVVALQATNIEERYYENTARDLGIEEEDVRTCAIKANVTAADTRSLEYFIQHRSQTTDLEDKVIRVGCFLTCLYQKKGLMSGAHINADNIKKRIRSSTAPEAITEALQEVDSCVDRVKNETKECEVIIKYIMCLNE